MKLERLMMPLVAVATINSTALAQNLSQREVIEIALRANPTLKAARAVMAKEARTWKPRGR